MRIGILFGGRSREREISFAGGRTVYDLLDKSLFTPVPIFIDSLGNFILLDWQYLYKGSIKDFYPPVSMTQGEQGYQVYIESLNPTPVQQEEAINAIGQRVAPEELKGLIDFAFLALHGPYGEDGSIQGILEFYDIPYSGSGVLPSAIGINKSIQKQLMEDMGILAAKSLTISRNNWLKGKEQRQEAFKLAQEKFQLPVVIKSSTQGSSIGVSILREWSFQEFENNISESFFIKRITKADWENKDAEAKRLFIQQTSDIYEGAGIPFKTGNHIIHHQAELQRYIEAHFATSSDDIYLESLQTEPAVLIEEFIDGKEFSCIVIEGAKGEPIALPPTEIIKKSSIFDYRAKYLPGISRKVTPIDLPEETINKIAASCERMYQALHFDVYARIDGLIKKDGSIYLNDPNTTSGMLPSSFFFHQAAEIGLSPGQFLTYIIHKSLEKRRDSSHTAYQISEQLDSLEKAMHEKHGASKDKLNVAVVLGGYSSERHISVESGRNVFEKISSSGKYNAFPVLLTKNSKGELDFYILPLNLLLKDNADDIAEKASHYSISPVIEKIIDKAQAVTSRFSSSNYEFYPKKVTLDELGGMVDFVFIGLHGRPGEDGELQKILQEKRYPIQRLRYPKLSHYY
jgi:D-alanine-D-alanine ligase